MTRRRWIRALVVLGASSAMGLFLLTSPRLTVQDVEAQLQRLVSPGATIGEVAAKLDSLGVDRSPLTPESTELRALWRRTRVGLIDESSIQARFLFDERGALIRYEVKELITAM
jgi:hypothetical protein